MAEPLRPETAPSGGRLRDRLRELRDALRSSARSDAYALLFARHPRDAVATPSAPSVAVRGSGVVATGAHGRMADRTGYSHESFRSFPSPAPIPMDRQKGL